MDLCIASMFLNCVSVVSLTLMGLTPWWWPLAWIGAVATSGAVAWLWPE
jgi:hypothetical protein